MTRLRHWTAAALLAGTLVATAACGSSTPVLTADDSSISVSAGERFRIELDANPSVGDDWRVTDEPDPAVAELVGSEFVSDNPDEKVVGAGGKMVFTFEATGAGATDIALFNCFRCGGADEPRPEDKTFAETVRYDVTVP